MFWLWTILLIIVWIAIAFWPARVAARKGHSFFLYFLFSIVFFQRTKKNAKALTFACLQILPVIFSLNGAR